MIVEKIKPDKMLEDSSSKRIFKVTPSIGAAMSGFISDARQLVVRARSEAHGYHANYGSTIPMQTLADRIGTFIT